MGSTTPSGIQTVWRIGQKALFVMLPMVGLVLTGTVAGAVNAIAGGGPMLTLCSLALLGIDPRTTSLTSTVALSPGQIVAGAIASRWMTSLDWPRARMAFAIGCAVIGSAGDGVLLLQTSAQGFRVIVPWLVLFATVIYALIGSHGFSRARWQVPPPTFLLILLARRSYDGYFGDGNSFHRCWIAMPLVAIATSSLPRGESRKKSSGC